MPQYDFLNPEATKEFRETEKAMSKKEYPQAGPPYDKTTYMGRIRDKIDTADNAFSKSSRDYRSTVDIALESAAGWYSLVNTAIDKLGGPATKQEVRGYLVTMRRKYIKGG